MSRGMSSRPAGTALQRCAPPLAPLPPFSAARIVAIRLAIYATAAVAAAAAAMTAAAAAAAALAGAINELSF